MPKKYVVSLFFLLLGLISIHFLKNETREMEVKIEKLSKNISYLKQDLEVETVSRVLRIDLVKMRVNLHSSAAPLVVVGGGSR